MCPYPKSEGWKQKQYFLRAPASCQNCLLLAGNIKGSSVEINVNELKIAQWNHLKIVTFYTWVLEQKKYFLSASASCQKGPFPTDNIKGNSVGINVNEPRLPCEIA